MKRLILTAVTVGLMSGTALAADVIVVPPAPPAPPVVIVEEPDHNFYMSIFGGLLYIQDVTGNAEFGPEDGDFILGTNRGYRFGAALGFGFNDMLGAEVEVAYGRATFDAVQFLFPDGEPAGGPVDLDGQGHGTLFTVMGNLRAGFGAGAFQPYVAVGAGAASVGIHALGMNDGGTVFPNNGADDKDWTWAFQAMAGVDFAITDNLSIGARYRFQRIGPTDFVDMDNDPITLEPFNTHGVEAVFTIHF